MPRKPIHRIALRVGDRVKVLSGALIGRTGHIIPNGALGEKPPDPYIVWAIRDDITGEAFAVEKKLVKKIRGA